jgi:tetratricopeptide (TPR) repeat protein
MRLATFPGILVILVAPLAAQNYETLFQQAAKLAGDRQYEQAITKYQAALRLRPGAPEALNNLAAMFYAARRYPEALETASGIWRDHPEMFSAALIAGLAAIQCNRPKDAIAPLEQALKANAPNRDALIGLATAHLALGDLARAATLYQRQTTEAPKDLDAWYDLAICYERMAEAASRKLAQMPGGLAYFKRFLGEFLLSRGDVQLAREAFGEAETAEGSPEAGTQYATARELAGQSRQAFETFIALAPDSWQAHLFLGDVDRQHRKFPSAIEHYGKAARAQPNNPAPQLGMGTVYWELGDFDRATQYLRETLRLNPHSSQATFELANIAVRLHEDAEAIPLLKSFLAEQPDAQAARADLGRAYLHLGQFENAADELAKAAPGDERGEVHYQLATALRKLGRIREADEALQKSTELRDAQLQREQRLVKPER